MRGRFAFSLAKGDPSWRILLPRIKDNVSGGDADKRGADPTIVGGRPLALSRSLQGIPRGIGVLIKIV